MTEKTNPFAWSKGPKFYETMDAMRSEIFNLRQEIHRLNDQLADSSRTNYLKTEG